MGTLLARVARARPVGWPEFNGHCHSGALAVARFGVMAADDEHEAQREAWAYSHAMMRMTTRRSFVVPTAAEADAYDYSPTESRIMDMWNAKIMSGTGAQVVEKLDIWQRRIDADELMILNLGHSPRAIYRSTELIADAYGLPRNVNQ